jgi:RES domain-containing protein
MLSFRTLGLQTEEHVRLCAYEVDCEDVFDLTDTATLAVHGITPADLACPWKDLSTRRIKPPSWEIAERLSAAGTAGVIVSSFAKGAVTTDINVVFWDWASDPPHQLRVIDDDRRLPKDASSAHGHSVGYRMTTRPPG